ncbi:MAG: PEP-CTERM motif protein [Candidatus Scalindua rubra]|uniref:PEP-CTERM motif protein n=1 Tax=Candidatus Scalindua rubra TaxID=1872076 RepID=A0A1E3X8A1_9BACT|nr:MAG: PEP-CTERM motif protein [Candidatus Scalindua rubra]
MQNARASAYGGVVGDSLYVMGGWNNGFVNYTEEYTPEPISEPTTIAVLWIDLAGLAGMAARRRFKQKILGSRV